MSSSELPTTSLLPLSLGVKTTQTFWDQNNVKMLKRKKKGRQKTFTSKLLISVHAAALLPELAHTSCECARRGTGLCYCPGSDPNVSKLCIWAWDNHHFLLWVKAKMLPTQTMLMEVSFQNGHKPQWDSVCDSGICSLEVIYQKSKKIVYYFN